MKLFQMLVFKVSENADTTEGRSMRSNLIGYFTMESAARKAAVGRGVMGSGADVEKEMLTVKVFESYAEFQDSQKEDLKKSALQKLSAAEREALGF